MIFIEGLLNAKTQLLYIDVNVEGITVSRFVSDVEAIINKSILGAEDNPCQWMCPWDTEKKKLVLLLWITFAHVKLLTLLISSMTFVSPIPREHCCGPQLLATIE
jgi:hypothetical protein